MKSIVNDVQINLQEKGFAVIPNFLSKAEVEFARNECETLIAQEKELTLKPTTLLKNKFLSNIIFSPNFKNYLSNLSQEYKFFLPNFTVRKNLYIGWHTDDEFVDLDEGSFPGVLQCNIYLQDNSKEYGGGIDIAVGTHKFSKNKKKNLIKTNGFLSEVTSTQAGDLLIFDYRVIHRSTMPTVCVREESRLALQWTVCKSFKRAEMFTKYLVKRQKEKLHLSDFTDTRSIAYFFDAANVNYPTSFLPDIQKIIEREKIIIPSVEMMNI